MRYSRVLVRYHDFLDGEGPVLSHVHPNGGGQVADTAIVSPEVYVDRFASILGCAKVEGLVNLRDRASIRGHAQVIAHRESICMRDNARVGGHAKIKSGGITILGNAYIGGSAIIQGKWILIRGHARIEEGVVTKTPILLDLGGSHLVTITDKHIRVGCACKTLSEWQKLSIADVYQQYGVELSDSKWEGLMRILNILCGKEK